MGDRLGLRSDYNHFMHQLVKQHGNREREQAPNVAAGTSVLYRRIWRWHFFAGLFSVPFILSLAITGGLYLFHRQIDDTVYAAAMLREAPSGMSARALPPSRLIAAALQVHPGRAKAFGIPADARHNAQVDVGQPDGGTLQVFVDPSTGAVAGAIRESERIMTIVKHVHSLTVAGKAGRALIEIVAGWIIVLSFTGVYLWWPRGRRAGVVSIRPRAEGRVWWRDLHAVTGAFGGIVVLFLALTGMPWSVFWGQNVNAWLTEHGLGTPVGVWSGIPKSTLPASAMGELPWAQQQDAIPASSDPHALHQGMNMGRHAAAQAAYSVLGNPHVLGPDAVVAQLAAKGMDSDYRLVLPASADGVYSAIRMPGQRERQRVIHLDQYSGKILMDLGPDATGAIGRVTEWGVAVHQGGEYGTPNLLLMLAGCLALVVLCISGIAAWWKRRPAGSFASPARKDGDRLAKGVIAIAVVLGCLFPLLGLSMLAIVLADSLSRGLFRACR
jgi:uncharacterized iron-regulated membrane protein